ncbi:hypothetical protein LSTR_LSTR006548 [Laodelphax striatellus]|uniref:Uncharacterized protein n=1 Tax=Laodelphax striatellus TaxID=195883 RepID=A0A482WGD4_LAOST|nr:hypothetical protein LSTR_LSTR006548 [Laodelphax striatellus]
MLEKRDSDERKGHKNSKIERTLLQSSICKARARRESMKTSEICNKDEELSFQKEKKMKNHNFKLDLKEVSPKMSFENANMRTQSCCRNEIENFRQKCNDAKRFDLVDSGGANIEELHERENNLKSTKNNADEVSPAPSCNSLLMYLTNIMDGVYLKLFNEILIRSFENSSISLENHVVILRLYKNSMSSMLNNKIDCQTNLRNCDEIEKGLSGILKCFVTSKGVEVVENLVSRFLLQLRRPYRNESGLYVQNMNPISFVANYMESVEIIVVGLVARQITRLLKSVSIRKTDKILDSFLNQLNLLKPILGVSSAKNDKCNVVAEGIQELVLFFLEGICDPSNMQEALELVNIHLAMIENMKLLKTRKGEGNFLSQYLSENMRSNIETPTHVNKNSKCEKMYLEEIQQFENTDHDLITNSSHKENESLCFKNVSNSMIDFRRLKNALGLTIKHVTDAITAIELEKLFSYYKDVCEKLLCEHCTTNLDLKPSVLEFEGEIKFILQFIDRQFVGIIQNIDCEISRASLLVDLEYIFDDHIRILKFLVTEIIQNTNENRPEETLICFRSEIVLDSAVQTNTRVQSPSSEKKEETSLNFVEKKTSSRGQGRTSAKNHELLELTSSTKHEDSNDFSRPGGAKSKPIQSSNQVDKNDLIIIGKNITRKQPQFFSKDSNSKNVSPAEQHSMKSNGEKYRNDENSSTNGNNQNPNSNSFLDLNRKSDKLGTGTSELDEEHTSKVGISPSFDLFCFIPNTLLTKTHTCDEDSNLKLPSGFKQCSFIDDPNLELAKKVLNRSLNRLARSYDRADLNSYLECLLIEIDDFLEPEHRTKTHYIEHSLHSDLSQFLPRTVLDIKKFLIQCASRANNEQEEIGTLKNEISHYILLYCKSEIITCSQNGQTDSVLNLSALPSISVDGLRVSYNILENRDQKENSDELLKQVPSKILMDQSDFLPPSTAFKPPSINLIETTSCSGSTSSNQNINNLEDIETKQVASKIFNSLDQSDVLQPTTNFKLSSIDLNEKSCLGSTSSNQNNIYVEDIETSTQSVLNYSHLKNDDENTVEKICVGIKDYFNHCKSTMTQSMYKSFSSQYLENILSSLQTSENNHDKADQKIEVDIKDYFNHCKSSMAQDNYESFSSHYFENILESLNTHRKSLEMIDVPQEYRNQQVYTVVEEMNRPREENIVAEEKAVEERVVAEGVDSHTASVERRSKILSSVVDNVAVEDQVVKTNTNVKLRGNWEDLCSLECHWPVIMKYRVGNYRYGFEQIGECDVECSEPIRMKYPLASDSERKRKPSEDLEGEKRNLDGFWDKIKYEERMDNLKALLKSLIEYGHPPTSDDESLLVTDDETARTIDKSNEGAQENPCCDVCPIYCPCCIYNKNNPSSDFFIKNLQKDLKSKLDSVSGENENASSLAENKNVDDDKESNVAHSIEEEIVQKFIMESAQDLYEKHHLPNSDSPDHKKEDLGETESRENNNDSENKGDDVQNHLDNSDSIFQNLVTDYHNLDSTDEQNIEENRLKETHERSSPSKNEMEIHVSKTGSLENARMSDDKHEVIQELEEQGIMMDHNGSSTGGTSPSGEVGKTEQDGFEENIVNENQPIKFEKKECKKFDKKETEPSIGKSDKPFDNTGDKNDTNLIKDSQNISEDVREKAGDTEGEFETSDMNENSKNKDLSGGISRKKDKSRNTLIDKIRSGGGEPACSHERNCPHRRMNNSPDLEQPCENDGDFEPPSVISLLSSLNILKNKVIVKDQIIQCLADQLVQMAQEGCLWKNDMLECISTHPSKRYVDFDSAMVADYLAGYVYEKPNKQPCVYIDLPDHPLNLVVEDFISFDAVKIAWQPPPGCIRSGFDVYVNDELVERIRDADGLATIVSNLDTKFVNLITVVMLDPDCMHCLMDTICISAANIKKQNRIANYYQAIESEDEINNSSSSSSEDVSKVNSKVTVKGSPRVNDSSLKFRKLKKTKISDTTFSKF